MSEIERIDYLIKVFTHERDVKFENEQKDCVFALTEGINNLQKERDLVLSNVASIVNNEKINELKAIIDLRDAEIKQQNAIIDHLKTGE